MTDFNWLSQGFRLRAQIVLPIPGPTNVVGLTVASFTATFELNGIPECQLSLAVGRNAYDVSAVAEVHTLVNDLGRMLPITVWAAVDRRYSSVADHEEGSSKLRFPVDRFAVFEGYVVGTGFNRDATGAVSATLGCTHWLSDLAFSSAVSRTSSPSNPIELSFGASYRMSATGGKKSFTWGPADSFVTATTVSTDFWGSAVYPLLAHVCSVDRMEAKAINLVPGLDVEDKRNTEALRALRRFEGSPVKLYRYAQALKLDPVQVGSAAAAGAIAASILGPDPDTFATTTLWDKLVGEILPSHLLSLVPMVDRALVVPFVPGLRKRWMTLYSKEYTVIQQSQRNPRPLRGVGLVASVTGVTGGILGASKVAAGVKTATVGIGGYYENPDPLMRRGMVHFKAAPAWLVATNMALPPAHVAAPPAGVRGAAAAPGVGARVAAVDEPARQLERARTLWNSYARALYNYEILRGRSGTISGAFRMDVAPGSNISIIVMDDDFVSALVPDEEDISINRTRIYATVSRVTLHMDAERGKASTLLQIDHIRTDKEASSDATSTNRHPLWDNIWTGAPLANRAAFDRSLAPT
jgi:hypothetical protein